ncbi:MAG: hypothetical protein ACP6IS_10595 [Candidatus Asgardarchaeia archaeon]
MIRGDTITKSAINSTTETKAPQNERFQNPILKIYNTNSYDILIKNTTIIGSIEIGAFSVVKFENVTFDPKFSSRMEITVKDFAMVYFENVSFISGFSIKTYNSSQVYIGNVLKCASSSDVYSYDHSSIQFVDNINLNTTLYITAYNNSSSVFSNIINSFDGFLSGVLYNNASIMFKEVNMPNSQLTITLRDFSKSVINNTVIKSFYASPYEMSVITIDNLEASDFSSIYSSSYSSVYIFNSTIGYISMYRPNYETILGKLLGPYIEIHESNVTSVSLETPEIAKIFSSNITNLYFTRIYSGNVLVNATKVIAEQQYANVILDDKTIITNNNTQWTFFINANVSIQEKSVISSFVFFNSTVYFNNTRSIYSIDSIFSNITGYNASVGSYYIYYSTLNLTSFYNGNGIFLACNSNITFDNFIGDAYNSFTIKKSYAKLINATLRSWNIFDAYDSELIFINTSIVAPFGFDLHNITFEFINTTIDNLRCYDSEGTIYISNVSTLNLYDTEGLIYINDTNINSLTISQLSIYSGEFTLNSSGLVGTGNYYASGAVFTNATISNIYVEFMSVNGGNTNITSVNINNLLITSATVIMKNITIHSLDIMNSKKVDILNCTIDDFDAINSTVAILASSIDQAEFSSGQLTPFEVVSYGTINGSTFKILQVITGGEVYINNSIMTMFLGFWANITIENSKIDNLAKDYIFNGTGSLIDNTPSGDYYSTTTVINTQVNTTTIGVVGAVKGTLNIKNSTIAFLGALTNATVTAYNTTIQYMVYAENRSSIVLNSTFVGTIQLFDSSKLVMKNTSMIYANSLSMMIMVYNNSNLAFHDIFVNVTTGYLTMVLIADGYANILFDNVTFLYKNPPLIDSIMLLHGHSILTTNYANLINRMMLYDNATANLYNTKLTGEVYLGGQNSFKLINNETFINSSTFIVTNVNFDIFTSSMRISNHSQFLEISNACINAIIIVGNTTAKIENVTTNVGKSGPYNFIAYTNNVSAYMKNITTGFVISIRSQIGALVPYPINSMTTAVTFVDSLLINATSNSYLIYGNGSATMSPNKLTKTFDVDLFTPENYTNCNTLSAGNLTSVYLNDFVDLTISDFNGALGYFIASLILFREKDTTLPIISASSTNVTFEVGMSVTDIQFTLTEENPHFYRLLRNSTIIAEGRYANGQIIEFDPSTLSPGYYYLTLWANDTDGNTATKSVNIRIYPPEAPVITSAPKQYLMINGSYALNWSAEDMFPAYYLIYINGTLQINNTWVSNSKITYLFNKTDGIYNVTIILYDKAGHLSKQEIIVSVDLVAPSIQVIKIPESFEIGEKNIVFTFRIVDNHPSYYLLYVNNEQKMNTTYAPSATITIPIANYLTVGNNTIKLIAYDTHGNLASIIYQIEVYAAENPKINSSPESELTIYDNETITLTWVARDATPSYYELYVNGSLAENNTWTSGTPIQYVFQPEQTGNYTIKLILFDRAGHKTEDTVLIHAISHEEIVPAPEFPLSYIVIGVSLVAIVVVVVVFYIRKKK